MARIGVQAMMLRNGVADVGIFETMRRVREIGYRAVEVSQIPMTPENVDGLERSRAELGIEVAGLSAALRNPPGAVGYALESDLDKIVADATRLDSSLIRIGMLPRDALASLEGVLSFCDAANRAAERLADHGIRLCYHNHHLEFAKYDGRYLLDVIAERAPLVGLELDVHWIHRGGFDPVQTLRRWGERVVMVHLKDYRIGRIPESAFASLSEGDDSAFAEAVAGVVQFAEVGEGSLDFRSIIDESVAIGARYLLVEQDQFYGRTALECLQTSYSNLIALGYERLM